MTTVVIFAELNLSSTTTIRTALSGFDVVYDGNTYLADGYIADISETKRSLAFENITQQITLNLVSARGGTAVRDAFRDNTYRSRTATIYKADVDDTGQVIGSSVVILKKGPMDAMNDVEDDGTVTLIVSSEIVRSMRTAENVAIDTIHQDNVRNGKFGSSTEDRARVDKIFENAQKTFEGAIFGKFSLIEAKYKRKKILGGLGGSVKELKSPERPARAGQEPTVASDDFQPAKVYGTALVDSAIINAWNPSESLVSSNIGGITTPLVDTTIPMANRQQRWYGSAYPDEIVGSESGSRFLTVQYVVAVGEVDELEIHMNGVNYSETSELVTRIIAPRNPSATDYTPFYLWGTAPLTIPVFGFDFPIGTQNVIGAYGWVQWGSDDQQALTPIKNLSNGIITDEHRGLGHVIVTITYEATRDAGIFSNGLPDPSFRVTQTNSRYPVSSGNNDITYATKDTFGNSNFTYNSDYNNITLDQYSLWRHGDEAAPTVESSWYYLADFAAMSVTKAERDAILINYGVDVGVQGFARTVNRYVTEGGILRIDQGSGNFARYEIRELYTYSATPNVVRFRVNPYPIEVEGQFNPTITTTFRVEQLITGVRDRLSTSSARYRNTFENVFLDYLTNGVAGPGISESDIDVGTFDQASSALFVPKTCNGLMQGRGTYFEYIEDLQDSSGLTIYEEDGKIKCYYTDIHETSDINHVFTKDNTLSTKISSSRSTDRYNRFILKHNEYFDENEKAPELSAGNVSSLNPDYLAEDLLQDNLGEPDAPFLSTYYIEDANGVVQPNNQFSGHEEPKELFLAYATLLMDKSRYSDTVEVEVEYQTVKDMKLGQPFIVEKEVYGWTGVNRKVFEAIEIVDNHDGSVTITGVQHSNTILGREDDYGQLIAEAPIPVVSGYVGTLKLPPPGTPTGLSVTVNAVDRSLSIGWTAPTTGDVLRYIVQFRYSSSDPWLNLAPTEDTQQIFITGNEARADVEFRVYAEGTGGLSQPSTTVMVNIPASLSEASALNLTFRRPSITVDGDGNFVNGSAVLELFDGESRVEIVDTDQDSGVGTDQYRVLAPMVTQTSSVNDFTAANAVVDTANDTATFALSGYVNDGTLTGTVRYQTSTSVFVEISAEVDIVQSATGAPGTPGTPGEDGYNTATVELFRATNANTTPNDPTNTLTYTFSSGSLTTPDNSWQSSAPSLTSTLSRLWKISASVRSKSDTVSIAPSQWVPAQIVGVYGDTGPSGSNQATIELFNRSSTTTAPVDPTNTLTYTFASNTLTTPDNFWTRSAPTITESSPYLWKISRSVTSVNETVTIAPSDWSEASIVGRYGGDGAAGTPGTRGAGRWYIPVTSLPTTTTEAQAAWTAWTNRPGDPVAYDQAWFYTGTVESPSAQTVWIRDPANAAWIKETNVIDGNLLVAGTVSLDRLAATGTSGNSRVVINGDGMGVFDGSESAPRVIVGNLGGSF